MKIGRSLAGLLELAMLLWTASVAFAQSQPDVRRARPVDEQPAPHALPADESIDKVLRSLKDESSEAPAREGEASDQRQLDYANGLFTRKLYDLAAPEYQKYLDDFPGRPGPAYALAEMAFADKDYAAALPLFHRANAKSKEPTVVLSARYFEARCLEATGRKEE